MSELPGVHPPLLAVREAVGRALAEDLLPLGDITASLLPSGARTDARLVARAEGVLVKDNHLGGTTIATAVATARDRWPGRLVEVECDRPEQVLEAVESGAGQVLLDNMTPEQVAACVALVRDKGGPGVLVEISGGVSLETAGAFAAAGVDLISVGAITHSAPALDIGLDLAVVEA